MLRYLYDTQVGVPRIELENGLEFRRGYLMDLGK